MSIVKPRKFVFGTAPSVATTEEAKELLEDPVSLYRVKCILDHDIVGEDTNKLTTFEVLLSRHLPEPLAAVLTGQSAGGKNWVLVHVVAAFPPDDVIDFTRITPAALDRLGSSMSGMILTITELTGAEAASSPLRIMLSERGLKLLTTDAKTREPIMIETKGCPAFATTSTLVSFHREFATRVIFLGIDESEEQTKRIQDHQKHLAMFPWDKDNPNMPLLRSAVASLRECQVCIPFANKVRFTQEVVRVRRDFPKFLELVKVTAYWHQLKRCEFLYRGERVIMATLADYEVARRLMSDILTPTLSSLPPRALRFLEKLMKEISMDEWFDSRRAAEVSGLSGAYVRELLKGLDEQGFLERTKEHGRYLYMLREHKSYPADKILTPVKKLTSEFDEDRLAGYLRDLARREPKAKLPEASEAWLSFEEQKPYDPITGERVG